MSINGKFHLKLRSVDFLSSLVTFTFGAIKCFKAFMRATCLIIMLCFLMWPTKKRELITFNEVIFIMSKKESYDHKPLFRTEQRIWIEEKTEIMKLWNKLLLISIFSISLLCTRMTGWKTVVTSPTHDMRPKFLFCLSSLALSFRC